MKFRGGTGIYAVTPDWTDAAAILAACAAVLAGGVRVVQLRSKRLSESVRIDTAHRLTKLCEQYDALCLVNDSASLCCASGAHGVHIGKSDDSIRFARTICPDAVVGMSCGNDMTYAQSVSSEGADYVSFGAVFPTTSKQGTDRISLTSLAAYCRMSSVPVVAVGGIDIDNIQRVCAAGVSAVAVIAALFDAEGADTDMRCYERRARRLSALFYDETKK